MIDHDIFLICELCLLSLWKMPFRLRALLPQEATLRENGILYLTAHVATIDWAFSLAASGLWIFFLMESSRTCLHPQHLPQCLSHGRWMFKGRMNRHVCRMKVRVLVALFATVWLCNLMDCSLPDSSPHGILQARILNWVTIPFPRGSSWSRIQSQVSCVAGRFFTIWVPAKV